jgi:hypothetical protein
MAGENQENIVDTVLSFFNPKANRARLEEAGLYQPRAEQGEFPVGQTEFRPAQGSVSANKYSGGYNKDAAAIIINEYIAAGFDPMFAAGMAANAQVESGGNPLAHNPREDAIGLFQHTPVGGRADNLRAFASARGVGLDDIAMQSQFTIDEWRGAERMAYDKVLGGDPQSAGDYAALIDKHYERSDGKARATRVQLGHTIYDDFFGSGKGSPHVGGGGVRGRERGGGGAGAPQVAADPNKPVDLSFGSIDDGVDPYAADSGAPFSMGMDAEDYDFLRESMGDRGALNTLNSTASMEPMYQDAILRLLESQAGEPKEEKTAAEDYGDKIGLETDPNGVGFSMGKAAPPSQTKAGVSGGGGGNSPKQGTSVAPQEPEQKAGPIERFLDTIYGTKDDNQTRDEERDRKRAIGMALSQGFQMLSDGSDFDVQPIVAQRMELQQMRRASEDLKKNAQGVSDMLVAAGYTNLAQLPFAGEQGMTAAMNVLQQQATAAPADRPFDLPPEQRAVLAQTMEDMGRPDLGQMVMTMPAGDGFKELYSTALGYEPPKTAEGGAGYTPEQRTSMANVARTAGYPTAADAILAGADPDKILPQITGVATDIATAGGQAGIELETKRLEGESLAAAYDSMGDPRRAEAVRASGNAEQAQIALDAISAEEKLAREEAAVKERGAAVAEAIPDDLPNAKELKAVAKAAITSADLEPVYKAIEGSPKTTDQQNYELAKKDPGYMQFLTDQSRARAGQDPRAHKKDIMLWNEIDAATKSYIESADKRAIFERDMQSIIDITTSPDFESGVVDQNLLVPAQRILTSVFGEGAPDLVSDSTMTGAKVMSLVQDANFALASQDLAGAISNLESENFKATFPTIGDSKTQILATAQYHLRNNELRDEQYNAMVEWVSKNEGANGSLGDRRDMYRFIEEQTKDIQLFQDVGYKDAADLVEQVQAGLSSGKYQKGEVLSVVDGNGNQTYFAITE